MWWFRGLGGLLQASHVYPANRPLSTREIPSLLFTRWRKTRSFDSDRSLRSLGERGWLLRWGTAIRSSPVLSLPSMLLSRSAPLLRFGSRRSTSKGWWIQHAHDLHPQGGKGGILWLTCRRAPRQTSAPMIPQSPWISVVPVRRGRHQT